MSPLRRVVQGITAMLIAVCVVSGFLGLRAVVWRQEYQVVPMLESGVVASAAVAGALGLIYVVFGSLIGRILRIDWLSVQFGALVGALLYGGYNVVTPLTPVSVNEAPLWRALQGGIDGLWIGALVGVLVAFVSGRPLRFDRLRLTRYLTLFVLVLLIAWISLLIVGLIHLPEVASFAVDTPLLLILKLVAYRLEPRSHEGDHPTDEDYDYDETT
jgi:hypothetical protein